MYREFQQQLKKVRVSAGVLTLGTDNKWKPDERNSLDFGARESMENRYDGSPEENCAQFENDTRLNR